MDGSARWPYWPLLLIGFSLIFRSAAAHAAVIETSAMGSYSKSSLADGYQSTSTRYSGSFAFKFTQVSALEFEYAHMITKYSYPTTFSGLLVNAVNYSVREDANVYSANWVQNLVPAKFVIQPYFKVGVGKMVRKQTQSYLGISESASQKVVTGVGGIGLRIFLTRAMALKGEFTSYVPDVRFTRWKENQNFSGGLSWMF